MAIEQSTVIRSAPWVLTVALFVIWEAVCSGLKIPAFLMPAPSAIWVSGLEYASPIMMHATQTLMTTLAGFALAVVVGLLIGLAVGASPLVYKACYPLLVGFNSIPKVAFVPVLVVWFGIGTVPAILTAFLISFFPIVVNVATGLATLEPELEDVLRSLGANRWDIMTKVGLPRSLPYFFASLKVAITLAFVGSVIAETVASNLGIGYLMMSASSSMNMPLVFAGLIVIGVMGVVMYELFAVLETRLTGWAHRNPNAPG
jgi:NitT/TauT family transport system permease protein